MPVLEALRPFFANMIASPAHADDRPPAEARAAMHAMIDNTFSAYAAPSAPMPLEQDHCLPVLGGEIALRLYAPVSVPHDLPCHLYFHGGGFWLGTLDQSDGVCRALAADAGCVVVSVDYRLAPEHRFSTAAEDGYAALCWVADHAAALGVDVNRISVGGASAGGNLAAVICLMSRDRGGPQPLLQVLEIPVTDLTAMQPLAMPEDGIVIPSGKDVYGGYYLGEEGDARHPYASPLLAEDLSGLPPALVMCAEYDPLRPEGQAYAERLAEAGVAVDYRCWAGQFHGSQGMAALIPAEAADYRRVIVSALRHAHTA